MIGNVGQANNRKRLPTGSKDMITGLKKMKNMYHAFTVITKDFIVNTFSMPQQEILTGLKLNHEQ